MLKNLKLKNMFFGFTDGKHEFNEVDEETFLRSYFFPENINIDSITNNEKFIIRGTRGTGKTTFLRWLSHSLREDRVVSFILFKTDISESEKSLISSTAGIREITLEGERFGIQQDFKDIWRIILLTRICATIMENSHAAEDINPAKKY